MIYGHMEGLNDVRQFMMNCKAVFFLTGSRFFGNDKPGSDWDFFTQDDKCVSAELVKLGFLRIHTSGYKDQEVESVYRHKTAGIDVQMVRSAILKNDLQNYIRTHAPLLKLHNSLEKQLRTCLWDALYAATKGLMPDRFKHNGESVHLTDEKQTITHILQLVLREF